MPTPVLYIGLGTSGLRTLEEAQRFFYSCSPRGECRPRHTRFLFVETDASQEPARIMGGPAGDQAIEVVRTPIPAAEISVKQLEKYATTRVLCAPPPPDAQEILKIQEGKLIRPATALTLPNQIYSDYSHVFSATARKVGDASFSVLDTWIAGLNKTDNSQGASHRIDQGSICIRLREDLGKSKYAREILEVYVPEMPEKSLRRIEVLFNGVELIYQDGVVRWLPEPERLSFAGKGAGGMRSFGRIALWGESDDGRGRYLNILRSKIESLYNELAVTCGHDMNPVVYITGTFTGGTNSGMFIDVAYLCRDIVRQVQNQVENADVLGVFLLPPDGEKEIKNASNAYACLRDLSHFSKPESQFLAKWPQDVAVNAFQPGRTPFELTTLLSLSWVPDGKVPTLYRVAGLYLFLLGTGFGDYRKARIVDVAQEGQRVWKFSALGMTSLFYPRGEIRQCASSKFARDYLIERWLRNNESLGLAAVRSLGGSGSGGSSVPLDMAIQQVKPRIRKWLNEVLESVVVEMLSTGPETDAQNKRQPVMESVRAHLERARQRRQKLSRKELLGLLGESGMFYTWWKGRMMLTMNQVNQSLGEKIVDEIEFYENLPMARRILSLAADEIDQILGFWKKLAIENWNIALTKGNPKAGHPPLLEPLEKKTGVTLGQATDVFLSRIEDILQRMCLSLLREPLEKLAKYLRDGNTDRFTPREAVPDPAQVPNEEAVRQAQKLLESARLSLSAFEDAVGAGIKPNDMIHYHLRTGRFQGTASANGTVLEPGDVDEATAAFEERHSRRMATDDTALSHSSVLLSYGVEKLWGFLAKSGFLVDEKKAHAAGTLAGELIRTLSQSLELERLPDSGDASAITRHPKLPSLARFATRKMSVNLGVEVGTLQNANTHPKVIVTGDHSNLPAIGQFLEDSLKTQLFDSRPDACDELLGDMVVFFDERPVRELEDLARYSLWEPAFSRRWTTDKSLDCYIHT